jgi:hypothetical protein
VLNWSFAAAMSVILLVLSVSVPAVANWATRWAKRPRPA